MNKEFITENIGLVHICARKFIGRQVDYEDLVQIGCIGLIKAYNNFDKDRGFKFSTYAVPVILGEIKGFFRSDGIVKVSRRLKELSIKIIRLSEEICNQTGNNPSVKELAEKLGETQEDVSQAMCSCIGTVSLTMTNEDGEFQLNIPVPSAEEDITDKISLKEIINSLPQKDRELIVLRYFKNQTQTQVAKTFGCSQVQISRKEKKILLTLRNALA